MKGRTIWFLDLEKLEWNKGPQDSPTNNRFGHTSIIYQNKIYLFGGRTKYGGSLFHSSFSKSKDHIVIPFI